MLLTRARQRGRHFEFVDSPEQIGGEAVIPDYWFEAHHAPGRAGVRIAADRLRGHLPRTANAIAEFCTDVRVAKFSRNSGDDDTHIGLLYVSYYVRKETHARRPLALVGSLPNPAPTAVPKFWDSAPSKLREFTALVHDGLVEDDYFDNGIDSVADWMTMEEYASLTGVLDDIGPVTVSDSSYQAVDISYAPKPPEMGVIGHNGRHVAYMFDTRDPGGLAWSFGDDMLIQQDAPIGDVMDSVMFTRLSGSSEHP